MENIYQGVGSAPAQDAVTVTPSDVTIFVPHLRALRVGTGGEVVIITPRGTTLTFQNVQNGETLPIAAAKVLDTGTTASGIIGYYG